MTNLDKVREALGNYYFVAITTEDSQLAVDAQAALSAHVEEVRELVEAASKAMDCKCTLEERDSGHRLDCYVPELDAALSKLKGDPK